MIRTGSNHESNGVEVWVERTGTNQGPNGVKSLVERQIIGRILSQTGSNKGRTNRGKSWVEQGQIISRATNYGQTND